MLGQSPKEIQNYEIIDFLGEGLTSCVYKAIKKHKHWGLEQTVAIKVFKSLSQVPTLKQEMASLSRVHSRHCVRLYSYLDTGDKPALVLEYLEGISLQDLMRTAHLKEPHLQEEIIAQIQEGLRDLAEEGLCHGDLSPKNIFLTTSGVVKLLDFGLSGAHQGRGGTMSYVALEGWEDQSWSLASDLFSLGLLHYEMSQGKVVKTLREARERAYSCVGLNSLLKENPRERDFLPLKSEKRRRERLAEIVRLEKSRFESADATQTISFFEQQQPIKRQPPRFFASGVMFFSLLFSTQILHPSIKIPQTPKNSNETAVIDIRSHKWAKIFLYEKKGKRWRLLVEQYTPYRKRLTKKKEYVLLWKTHEKSGRILVHSDKNQRILVP